MSEQWNEVMQEVDRMYHVNLTSEGRIAHITDYIIRREAAELLQLRERVAALEAERAQLVPFAALAFKVIGEISLTNLSPAMKRLDHYAANDIDGKLYMEICAEGSK